MDWNDVLTLANTSETIAVYGIGAYLFLSRALGAWRCRQRTDSGTFTVHPEQPRRTMQSIAGKAVGVTTTGEDVGIKWAGYGEREPE